MKGENTKEIRIWNQGHIFIAKQVMGTALSFAFLIFTREFSQDVNAATLGSAFVD